jgi:hypothetical protein
MQQLLESAEKEELDEPSATRRSSTRWMPKSCLSISLIISACLNGILLLSYLQRSFRSCSDNPTQFGEL